MDKSSGLGAWFAVGANLISNDIGSVSQIGSPHGVFNVTGLDKSAMETVLTIRDGVIDFEPWFNDAAGQAHPVLSALPTGDTAVTFGHADTQGAAAACMVGKQINYDGNRPADGSISFSSNVVGNGYGLEWCEMLSPGITTSTGAENLASLNLGASTAFGLQAYLHVFAFTGTSCTITIEESSDDGGGDAFAAVTSGAFTAVTGTTTERIATSGSQTIEQYLRLALTGTYTSIQFVVLVNVNQTATSI